MYPHRSVHDRMLPKCHSRSAFYFTAGGRPQMQIKTTHLFVLFVVLHTMQVAFFFPNQTFALFCCFLKIIRDVQLLLTFFHVAVLQALLADWMPVNNTAAFDAFSGPLSYQPVVCRCLTLNLLRQQHQTGKLRMWFKKSFRIYGVLLFVCLLALPKAGVKWRCLPLYFSILAFIQTSLSAEIMIHWY